MVAALARLGPAGMTAAGTCHISAGKNVTALETAGMEYVAAAYTAVAWSELGH